MARNDDTTPPNSQPRNDAYTGMLIVSLVALILGGVLLFLDYSQYPDKKAPNVANVRPENPMGGVQQEAPAPAEQPAKGKKK